MRSRSLLLPALALALVAACSPSGSDSADVPTTQTQAPVSTSTIIRTSAPETIVATVTQTQAGTVLTAEPPPSTDEPAPVAGDCPYLQTSVVRSLTGQNLGTPQLIQVAPQPVCTFNRSDGTWAATVRIVEAPTPEQAVAVVNQHVPVADSMPASMPAGWTGGVMSEGGQQAGAEGRSVYAVSKGTIAVIAEENESRSIKARSLAVCAIFGAGLDTGPVPDYCGA